MNARPDSSPLESLRFDNRFTRELPADPLTHNQRRQVAGACYSRVQPKPMAAPRLVAFEPSVLLNCLSQPSCCGSDPVPWLT